MKLNSTTRLSKSCDNCRRRKIRCNRGRPCSQCLKSNSKKCNYNDWLASSLSMSDFEPQLVHSISDKAQLDTLIHNETKSKNQNEQLVTVESSNTNIERCKHQSPQTTYPRQNENDPNRNSDGTKICKQENNDKDTFQELKVDICIKKEWDFSIYLEFSSTRRRNDQTFNYGPYAWQSLIDYDCCLNRLRTFITNTEKDIVLSGIKFTSKDLSNAAKPRNNNRTFHTEKDFKRNILKSEGYEEKIGLSSLNSKDSLMRIQNDNSSNFLKNFEENVICILPKQKVIWNLVHIFFREVYLFIPILDEEDFKNDLFAVIGKEEYGEHGILTLSIEKQVDLATLGALFLVLRLTYCFISSKANNKDLNFSNTCLENNEIEYLLSNPINIAVVDMSLFCLNEFSLFKRSNLKVLQLAMLFKVYQRNGPETGAGADDCNSLMALPALFYMATSLGLNRKIVPYLNADRKTIHLNRKIWYQLVFWDVRQSFNTGCPLQVDESHYETPFPEFGFSSNVINQEIENKCIEVLYVTRKYYFPVATLIHETIGFNKRNRLSYLLDMCANLDERHRIANNELVQYCTHKTSKVSEVENLKRCFHLEIKCYLLKNFFLLLSYSEKRNEKDVKEYCTKKICTILANDILPLISIFFYNNDSLSFFAYPVIERALQVASVIFLSLLMKLKLTLLADDLGNGTKPEVPQLCIILKESNDTLMHYCSILSEKYCYAWQIMQISKFMIKILEAEESKLLSSICEPYPSFDTKIDEVLIRNLIEIFVKSEVHKSVKTRKGHASDDELKEHNNGKSKVDLNVKEGTSTDNTFVKTSDGATNYGIEWAYANRIHNFDDNIWITDMFGQNLDYTKDSYNETLNASEISDVSFFDYFGFDYP
ncbi:uncharacterized protein PRCAT00003298001 [Priceomyces carsonii]|uniref:uncharacterized protein n=1 Tax=Priceomyces carsonii TaxID=28549 RepID=UPI002ED8319B|nr:unnamed protein product [Priceomyces carsonii]